MIRKFKKLLKVVNIDILVYRMLEDYLMPFPDPIFKIESDSVSPQKKQFFIEDQGQVVHRSFLFSKVRVLKLVSKTGPVIGDCVTIPEYRGKSIYPFVIHNIAAQVLTSKESPEVFIIVNPGNINSIRGIEKAGFKFYKKIKAKRFLLFYYQIKIQ